MVASASELPPSQNHKTGSWLHFDYPLDKSDLRQISSLLGQMGLSYEYIENPTQDTYNPDSQIDRINRYGFRFTDINSEDDYIFREHFDYLAETNPSLSHRNFSRLFNNLVDGAGDTNLTMFSNEEGQNGRFIQQRPVSPLPGIRLVDRIDFGIGQYTSDKILEPRTRIIARYGIRVDTLLGTIIHHDKPQKGILREGSKRNQSISILIQRLSESIKT